MAPNIYTEVNGRLMPHPPDLDLPRVTYPARASITSREKVVDHTDTSSLVRGAGRRSGLVIVPPRQKTAIVVESPSEASMSVDSDSGSDSDMVVPNKKSNTRARVKSSTRHNVGTSGNGKTRNDVRSDMTAPEASTQHRGSVTALSESNDEETIMLDEPEDAALTLELSSHARYSSGELDILMSDVGAAAHTRSATAKQLSTRGSKPSASTPVRHKYIRNVAYLSCSIKEQAMRAEVITAINKNWPRARHFFPAHLAPRSSVLGITEPLEPRDVSRPLLLAVHGLSIVTLDHHERAFGAMLKAVKKRARKERSEEKLLLLDVEAAVKFCKAAEVYCSATVQVQSPTSSHSSLRTGSSTGTEAERSLSREAPSPVAVSARS